MLASWPAVRCRATALRGRSEERTLEGTDPEPAKSRARGHALKNNRNIIFILKSKIGQKLEAHLVLLNQGGELFEFKAVAARTCVGDSTDINTRRHHRPHIFLSSIPAFIGILRLKHNPAPSIENLELKVGYTYEVALASVGGVGAS